MAVVRESVSEADTMEELQEQAIVDPELASLKDAIRTGYFMTQEMKTH